MAGLDPVPLDPRSDVTPQDPSAALEQAKDEAKDRAITALQPVMALLVDLGRVFDRAGFELSLVGGPVRDALLGRRSTDLDFTTNARPDDTVALLKAWGDTHWEIGRDFGTIGARKKNLVVEVTTYRSESYDADSRKPEVSYGDDLVGDLSRRDFTVNAMALRLPAMDFVDPHGGLDDLAAGILRTPGTAEQSFSDDPLRMMRAARFAAQLRMRVAPDVVTAMTAMADRVAIVSAERVRVELEKTLLAIDPVAGLRILVDTGLAGHVLPELPALQLEIDEHHRHKDVYEHSLTVLEQAIDLETDGPDLLLRLSALLHDIGKPRTRRFEDGGGVSFHHHEVVGAKLVTKRLKALRFDNDTIKAVARLTELHLRFHGYGDGEWTDSAVRRYVTDAGPLLPRLHQLTRSDCTTRNVRKAKRLASAYDDLETRIARLREQEELDAIRPDLDGTQIMALLGIGPSRVVGRAYQHLLGLRMDRGPLGPEVAEQELRSWWAEQPEATEG